MPKILTRALTAVAAAALLAGCSTTAGSSTAAPSAAAATMSVAATMAPASAGAASPGSDIPAAGDTGELPTVTAAGGDAAAQFCTALPAAKARQLTGLDISQADPVTAGASAGSGCAYSSADSSVQVQVLLVSGDPDSSWTLVSQAAGNTAVTGVGDKAVYDGEGTLYALAHGLLLQVNGVDTQAQAVALATAVLPLL